MPGEHVVGDVEKETGNLSLGIKIENGSRLNNVPQRYLDSNRWNL